jgi:Long-chain fatty acid transport protein
MKTGFKALTAVGLILAASQANAAGFAIKETSGMLTGQAYAGAASMTGDLSTMWNNPASMTYLNKNEMTGALNVILPSAKFKRGSGTTVDPLVAAAVRENGNGGNGGKAAFVPAFYGMWNVANNFKAGLGITAPFGLMTEYGSDWVGRYNAIKSSLKTININPNLAYKVNEHVSLGFGVSFQYADVELTNKAFVGTDVFNKVTGDDWGAGFNLGLLVEPMKGTKFGVSYRSRINHGLRGKISGVNNEKVTADLKTPDSVDFSASHDFNEQFSVHGSALLTRWSSFSTLKVVNTSGGTITNKPQEWKDVWFFALGLNYKPAKEWMLQLGVAYDQTPTRDKHRSPMLPDNNRTWVSTGVHYNLNDAFKVGLTYTHLFIKDCKINIASARAAGAPIALQGKMKTAVDIIGLQLNYKF